MAVTTFFYSYMYLSFLFNVVAIMLAYFIFHNCVCQSLRCLFVSLYKVIFNNNILLVCIYLVAVCMQDIIQFLNMFIYSRWPFKDGITSKIDIL